MDRLKKTESNCDSKAEGHQQTITHSGKQRNEERSTPRTPANAGKQAPASPPFG